VAIVLIEEWLSFWRILLGNKWINWNRVKPGEVSAMKKAVIVGASSGIGKELAEILAKEGYILGLAARRIELLKALQEKLPTKTFIRYIDLCQVDEAMNDLNGLIREMDGIDLIIISSGTGYLNPNLNWKEEKETIDVNAIGFAAMVNVALKHFLQRGAGHIVGISSIAALRGSGQCPSYNASKAFVSNYLEGISCKVKKMNANILVTDIKPGLVDTAMAKGEGLFWVAPPQKAATQIYQKIKQQKERAYITKRWGIIAFVLKIMPNWLYYKLQAAHPDK
jgi:short-subunit dehydrogenase